MAEFPEKSPAKILVFAGAGSVSFAGSMDKTKVVVFASWLASTLNDFGKVTYENVPIETGIPFTIIQPS